MNNACSIQLVVRVKVRIGWLKPIDIYCELSYKGVHWIWIYPLVSGREGMLMC